MISLLLAIGAPIAQPPPARYQWVSDEVFCSQAKAVANAVQAELPIQIDAATRLDGLAAICADRSMIWNRFINAGASSMRDGWLDRKQSQWSTVACHNAAYAEAARHGWRFIQIYTLKSGELFTQDAVCP